MPFQGLKNTYLQPHFFILMPHKSSHSNEIEGGKEDFLVI